MGIADRVKKILDRAREGEEWRSHCLNLIASENVESRTARRARDNDFWHRYAEGLPKKRWYQGTKYIDEEEEELTNRFKEVFDCKHVDVRPISGTNANEAVFNAFLNHDDVVFVNLLAAGGHISHNIMGSLGKITKRIMSMPLTEDGYHTDIDKIEGLVRDYKPRMIVVGKSLYLFREPVDKLAEIAHRHGAKVVCDYAHPLLLYMVKKFGNPFRDGADVVTGSTHKTFPGPQRGIILSNLPEEEWRKIDRKVFPGGVSNHHPGSLPELSVTLEEMIEYGEAYALQILENAVYLADRLTSLGFDVQARKYGFTETHQIAVDVSGMGGGRRIAKILEDNGIIVNYNLLPFEDEKNNRNPKGLRFGVQEMTRFGMTKDHMEDIAQLIREAVDGKSVFNGVKEFREYFQNVEFSADSKMAQVL